MPAPAHGEQAPNVPYPLAQAAADLFGLRQAHIEYAGGADFENPLFKVGCKGQRFALRLHAAGADEQYLRSVDLWLARLRHEAGLAVPDPVPGPYGQALQRLVPRDGPPRFCALYRWVEGVPALELPATAVTPQLVEKLGLFIGRLHQHAAAFAPPTWFALPRFDLAAARRALEADWAHPDLPEQRRAQLQDLGRRRLRLMAAWREKPEFFGPVHTDLSGLNVLVHQGDIQLIDFAECQRGFFLPNLVQGMIRALSLWQKEEAQRQFLAAYRQVRPVPEQFHEYRELWEAAAQLDWFWWQ